MNVVYPISKWNNSGRARARHIPNTDDGRPLCWKPGKFMHVLSWETEEGEPTCANCIKEHRIVGSNRKLLEEIRLHDAARDMLKALQAQEIAEACERAEDVYPALYAMNEEARYESAEDLFAWARELRAAAIAKAKGGAQ